MAVTIYVEGTITPEQQHLSLPLTSCVALLVASYSHPTLFHLVFVKRDDGDTVNAQNSHHITISAKGVESINHEFATSSSLPELVHNVALPAVYDAESCLVRSGLCVVIRHIIRTADARAPGQHLTDLLGFRQGSLRMCAEVSGWTKLCEVELPQSVAALIQQVTALPASPTQPYLQLPTDLIRLDSHLEKPPKVHNDDRMRRQELAQLQADVADPSRRQDLLKEMTLEKSRLTLERMTGLHHGWRKIRVDKALVNDTRVNEAGDGAGDGVDAKCNRATGNGELTAERISLEEQTLTDNSDSSEAIFMHIQSLTYLDIQLVHLYSEGVEITIADLCLFTYLYYLLESIQFDVSALRPYLPTVLRWLSHMTCLSRLESAAVSCGIDFQRLRSALEGDKHATSDGNTVVLRKPEMEIVTEDEMELSRRCQTKYRAIKPEVIAALNKLKTCGIEPEVGQHPRGTSVQLDWEALPPWVHPREGEVPPKRLQRKCQQLENLVTAVQEVAKPGDVIVDFCSGGGHLGIAIAYVLPDCKVYLVENKEESLVKARTRMDALNLTNVTLYQCNLDYFVGDFDVGVCLHACGSATDMVLHQCLSHHAAFVICPCCYGGIQQTHLLTYPRSRLYRDKDIAYTEFLTLGHAADQTEFNIALEQQGRRCMNLVDSDRAELAREAGYSVTLCSLYPPTCSPKNNLLIGRKVMTKEQRSSCLDKSKTACVS